MSYHNFPLHIINIILSYDGTIRFQNGKYMNQISKCDLRYDLIATIPKTISRSFSRSFFSNIQGDSICVIFSNKCALVKNYWDEKDDCNITEYLCKDQYYSYGKPVT